MSATKKTSRSSKAFCEEGEPKEEEEEDSQIQDEHLLNKRKYFSDAKRKGWRLIIRNLPFKTKKEDLQNVCSRIGPFTEIVLPKCKDKKYPNSCAGFAFVQFKARKDAESALQSLNMTELNGRKIAVDWAVPKDTYETASFIEKEREKRAKEQEKLEGEDKEREVADIDEEKEPDEDESNEEVEEVEENRKTKERTHKEDPAVVEGRVVFIRNLSFKTTNETLKEALRVFGEISLAIVCRYPESDHSKGTAFVYFDTRENAEACISASEKDPGIFIDGRRVYCCRAVSSKEAAAKEKERLERKPKDKRNLHLLRVGVIRAGTASARGMSDADAQKRARLALAARLKLRNLHMFVSPNRLVVHNLPPFLSDKAFRSLCFLAAGNPDAQIIECRIWRDMERTNSKGVAKSRGFGFVAFSEHADALAALRHLNNNPETFTDEKRPIVEFSIENLRALRLRAKRLATSKQKSTKETSGTSLSEKSQREVEETKRQIASAGQKPLPSHVGPKIRHRDLKRQKVTKGSRLRTNKWMKGEKRKNSDRQTVVPLKKSRKGRLKQFTKFMTLSS